MRQVHHLLQVATRGRGFIDVTGAVSDWLSESGLRAGVLTMFIRHTSASLVVQENADSAVLRDLEHFFARLVPDGDPLFTHRAEGADDMPAHVRSALTQTSLTVPFVAGAMQLGTWQAIYLVEHRTRAHTREIALHAMGD